MSEALNLSTAPAPKAVDVALFALLAALGSLPNAKALRRLDRMEAAALNARARAFGQSNVYRLRGSGTRDQMDAARRSEVDCANVLLAAVALYRAYLR